MTALIAVLVLSVPLLLATAVLLGRKFRRARAEADDLSPVARQHFEIFQEGQFDEAEVEAVKRRFRDLLERGEDEAVEASLRPGMKFVFQVRALAEIGTESAGQILERQLQRRLTDDRVEQTWYWIDLASSLRALNRQESLPHLFRCADQTVDAPLGHFFAAETVCFLGFSGYVRQPDTLLGRAALRLLHRALEGLRLGVQPHLVAEARLGEVVETLWDSRPDTVGPLPARVFAEALRLLRRAPHARAALADDHHEREAFEWQLSRIAALEASLREYLDDAPAALRVQLAKARGPDQTDILRTLADLRVDAGKEIIPLLERSRVEDRELAIDALRWAPDPAVGAWLRRYAGRKVDMVRRARTRRRGFAFRRPAIPADVPYTSLLHSLRGHPSAETEQFLILAAQDCDAAYRAAALSSLGWWDPVRRADVLRALEAGRRDVSQEVRHAARAALARLGERAALHWFRQALHSDSPPHVIETLYTIATEGLVLLWPDLDRLADADHPEIAQQAREASERLFEEMEQPQGR